MFCAAAAMKISSRASFRSLTLPTTAFITWPFISTIPHISKRIFEVTLMRGLISTMQMLLTLVSGPARAVSPGYPLRIVPLNETQRQAV